MIRQIQSAWRKSVERRYLLISAATWACLTISISSNHGRYSVKAVSLVTGVVVLTATLVISSKVD